MQKVSSRFYSAISVGIKENYGRIAFNRPEKYNCINYDTFQEIPAALKKLDEDDKVKFAVLTGEGKFYSAGNDINNFSHIYGRFFVKSKGQIFIYFSVRMVQKCPEKLSTVL